VADSAAQRHPHVIAGPSSDFTPGAVEQIDDTPPRNSSDTSLAGPTVRIPFAPPMSQLRTRLQHPSPNPMALRIVEQRSSLPAPGSPIRSSCETDPPLPEFAPDSLLEGEGFEPSVRRRGQHFFETAPDPGTRRRQTGPVARTGF
jgi:hypothetical protein